jgi:hypothetical protein
MDYEARDALRVARLTHRQMDHAIRSGVVWPTDGPGRGFFRQFSVRDLLALVLLGDVLRAGVRVQAVGPALRLIRRGRLPELAALGGVSIWTDGHAARVVRRGERLGGRRAAAGVTYLLDVGAAAKRLRAELKAQAA